MLEQETSRRRGGRPGRFPSRRLRRKLEHLGQPPQSRRRGDQHAGNANPASVDACVLLSQAQATQIVGTEVVKVSGSGAGAASTCLYRSTGTGASLVITVTQVPSGFAKTAVQQALLNKSGLTTLTGIGDAAGETQDANDVTIAFAKGQAFVILAASSATLSGAAMAPKLESLAKSIAGKV